MAGVVQFNDARRFGMMDPLAHQSTLAEHPLLAGLGPEPLEPEFNGAWFEPQGAGRSIRPA